MQGAHEDIQISWLRAFLAVHNTGSFTAAARQVYRAQSRVSAQVAQLERQLGIELFVRGRIPTCLTEAGAQFLPYARAALHEIESGAAAVSAKGDTIRGRVTVASYPGASALVLAPLIKRFAEKYPEAHVNLRDLLGPDDATSVLHGDVDLALHALHRPLHERSLLSRPVFREPVVCLVPSSHELARVECFEPKAFDGQRVIMTGEFVTSAGRYSALLASCGVCTREETVVGQPTTVAALAAAGMGLGILPALVAGLVDTAGRVRILPISAPGWSQDVAILTSRHRHYPPVVETFIQELLHSPLHAAVEPLQPTSQ